MDSGTDELVYELPPFIKVYKDGRVEWLMGTDIIPPSVDSQTGVKSKDVAIEPEKGIAARLYVSKEASKDQKLPVLIYFHGGGFYVQTPYSSTYQDFLNSLVAKGKVILVSVDYRRAPEHSLPIAYEDSWTAVKWVASHSSKAGKDKWLKDYASFDRVFFIGDSAGGNIAHNVAMRAGSEKLDGVRLEGLILMHPFFWGETPVGGEAAGLHGRPNIDPYWLFACPASSGVDDPWLNPASDPKLPRLGCKRVLVFAAEIDLLRYRAWHYYELLTQSEWKGEIEIMETPGEEHVFHLYNPSCKKAIDVIKKIVSFIDQENS